MCMYIAALIDGRILIQTSRRNEFEVPFRLGLEYIKLRARKGELTLLFH